MAVALALSLLGCGQSEPKALSRTPLTNGAGQSAVAKPAPDRRPRIAALDVEIYIRQTPAQASPEIGVLHFGSAIVRSIEPVSTIGCPGGWYAVEPEGFICHGRTTTLEPDQHSLVIAAREQGGDFSSPTPYRWFESRGGAPVYRRLPGKKALSLVRVIPARSTLAVTDELAVGDQDFLLTSELLWVEKSSVVEQTPSDFSGVHLDREKARLPLAFVRHEAKPKFRWVAREIVPASVGEASRRLEPSSEHFARLSWMALTGRTHRQRGSRYLETSSGDWIRETDATVVEAQPPRGFELEPGEKWIDVSIFKGTLVAYEGSRAVFATLISPGANGYKRIDGERARFTTPTGTFRLEWKHRSTDMTPDPERESYSLAEVPYTQFFHMPFALHAAYWHDRFGEPKSGGCVNLSPRDAQWLFEWTAPSVPAGWHGVRSGGIRGPGTWVRIR